MKDELGTRMKKYYEKRDQTFLTRRTPVIIRLDGKAFHTFTKKMERPYSHDLRGMMVSTAKALCKEVQGVKVAYQQSDEISLLLTDYDELNTQAWFDNKVQKICSVSASIATAEFNYQYFKQQLANQSRVVKPALFDSRCFNIPKEEVSNYFIWRFLDWRRNSIQLLAQSLFSSKKLYKKNTTVLEQMCFEAGSDWTSYADYWRNGTFFFKEEKFETNSRIVLPLDRKVIELYV